MKTFIKKPGICVMYTLLVTFLFCGCVEPNIKKDNTNYIMDEFGSRLEQIEVDNCEYIFYERGHRMMMAHKGNCKFCAERSKDN